MNRALAAIVMLFMLLFLAACRAATPLPPPALFPVSWDDRADFAQGLVSSRIGTLDQLPQATVYHIAVTLDSELKRLEGRQEMRVFNYEEADLDVLYLRLYPSLLGSSVTVDNLQVNGLAVVPAYELEGSALRVPLASPLSPDEQVVLTLDFAMDIPERSGLYNAFVYDREILTLPHFYPLLAVYDHDGWNLEIPAAFGDIVYSESSFYRVQVTAPAGVTFAASGIEVAREEQGEQQTIIYVAGPVRDFYLAGSPRFERSSRTAGETTINSYTFADYSEASEQVLDYAANAVASYERHFGTYPFVELDLVSTRTSAGGIEYPGIVANALRLYHTSSGDLERITSHEIAHQWFYSTVGNDQLDEPWLDEAVAEYAVLLYVGDHYGAEPASRYLEWVAGSLGLVGNKQMPVGLPVSAYSDGVEYEVFVYGQGALFFNALATEMGEETFAAFLREYYESHTWGIATTESLRAVAEETCACDLGALFDEWIYPEE